jgi:hypothetical protein
MTERVAGPGDLRKIRRLVAWGLIRALATTVVLVALYYVLPLDSLTSIPWAVTFILALTILVVGGGWQLRAVMASPNPAIRAIEGLAVTAPLFVLLFAATYYVMSHVDPVNFNATDMSRTKTLYFAVTVLSTVGFGDIVPTTGTSQVVVTLQMILDLLVLGLGLRVFAGAIRLGRARSRAPGSPEDDG